MAENVLTMPFDDCDAARRLVTQHRHELAAVLVNPVVTRGGLHLPSPGYLACLREVTRDNDVLLIFDEVITLRLARGGAQDYYGVVPDLTAMGKIVGGGLPVGAFGGRADILELFAAGDPPMVPHAGTFNGNPLTMAAGTGLPGAAHSRRLYPARRPRRLPPRPTRRRGRRLWSWRSR